MRDINWLRGLANHPHPLPSLSLGSLVIKERHPLVCALRLTECRAVPPGSLITCVPARRTKKEKLNENSKILIFKCAFKCESYQQMNELYLARCGASILHYSRPAPP